MSLVTLLQSALRHWLLIAVAFTAATGAGLLVAQSQPARFQSEGRFIIAPAASIQNDNDIAQSLDALANRRAIVSTFGQVVLSPRTFDEAVAAAGLAPGQARRLKVSAVVSPEANVVEVFVLGPNPELTERMVQLLGSGATRYFEDLYKLYSVSALDTARLETRQVAPRPALSAAVAGVLGAGLGFLLGLGKDWTRSRRPMVARPPFVTSSPTHRLGELPGATAGAGTTALPSERQGMDPGAVATTESVAAGFRAGFPVVGAPAREDREPGQSLVLRPSELSRQEPAHSRHPVDEPGSAAGSGILEDPGWWLQQLDELGREVRGWATDDVDDQERWRDELDDLSRLLSGWEDRPQEAPPKDGHTDSSSTG